MLEHGECSSKPHVGTHGDLPLHPHPHAPASAHKVPHKNTTHTKSKSKNVCTKQIMLPFFFLHFHRFCEQAVDADADAGAVDA